MKYFADLEALEYKKYKYVAGLNWKQMTELSLQTIQQPVLLLHFFWSKSPLPYVHLEPFPYFSLASSYCLLLSFYFVKAEGGWWQIAVQVEVKLGRTQHP